MFIGLRLSSSAWEERKIMKNIKNVGGVLACLAVLVISLLMRPAPAAAIVVRSPTGGDGYTPILHKMPSGETRIFTIYHHLKPSASPPPNNTINCVIASTSNICPSYPKYFSSTAGTSNTGPDDIATSFYPHYAIQGSKLYYTAQRASDNGVGCFDMEAGTNCGYTALGSLAMGPLSSRPAVTDGLEQVGDRLYSFGKDLQAYCFNLTTQTACVGQPYDVALGEGTLPAYDGQDTRIPREVIGTNIYLAVNYYTQSTPANARLVCFDALTNTRCAGWAGSVNLPGTGTNQGGATEGVSSIFAAYNTTGTATAVCTSDYGPDGASCWNLLTGASAASPPGLMVGLPASLPREETRLGNKTYFAFYQAPGGFAQCYDFTTQALCTGFGSPFNTWPGVNGGDTRDYGYTYFDGGCFFATGDTAVLWSFDPVTGATGDTSCPVATASLPALPNTGMKQSSLSSRFYMILGIPTAIVALAFCRRRLKSKYN
jgi:hypothetical protein